MKKNTFVWGMLVSALLCGLVLSGCPVDADDSWDNTGGIPSGNLGPTLSISNEQVYVTSTGSTGIIYTPVSGEKAVTISTAGITETAAITGGKLNVTISAVPSLLSPMVDEEMTAEFGALYDDLTISPEDANGVSLSLQAGESELSKRTLAMSISGTSGTMTQESVLFFYIDKDVTMTGKGKNTSLDENNFTTKDLKLNLKQGWNSLYMKAISTITADSTNANTEVTMSVGNPKLKWAYGSAGAGGSSMEE